MKLAKRIMTVLMAALMLFSVGCVDPEDSLQSSSGNQILDSSGASQDSQDNNGGNTIHENVNTEVPPDAPYNPVNLSTFGEVKGETHDYKMTETGKYIVENGRTDYKILIPEGMEDNGYIDSAVTDLRLFFMEATGLDLEVVSDNAMVSGGKYLAIHSTKLASAESVGATYDVLGKGGFRIKTVGESVVMCGATAESSMYATYAFLEVALGFELYYTDFYALDKGVENLKLMNYDVTDVPDFQWRMQSSGWIRYNESNRKRMRWTEEREWIIPVDDPSTVKEEALQWHNTFAYLPPNTYKADRPEFYSYPKGNQLCYTARGDGAKREEMLNIVANRIKELFSSSI